MPTNHRQPKAVTSACAMAMQKKVRKRPKYRSMPRQFRNSGWVTGTLTITAVRRLPTNRASIT